jgi:RNA polymerase sigma factor (sigma-70 family)
MSESRSEFDQLMEGVRAGRDDAARQLYEVYGAHVRRVVRRKMHMRLRSQYDSADFVQSVMASFFAIPADRYFNNPDELVDFLGALATNKVTEVYRRRLRTLKHDLKREQHHSDLGQDLAATAPTPSQAAIADEFWERLTSGKPAKLREVLELLRAGLSYEEIADRTGLHVKAIQRRVSRLLKENGS